MRTLLPLVLSVIAPASLAQTLTIPAAFDSVDAPSAGELAGLSARMKQQFLFSSALLAGLSGKTLDGLWVRHNAARDIPLTGGQADLTITLKRSDLDQVMMGAQSVDDLIKAGKAKFEGDRKPFDQLRGLMVVFTPDFEMLPGTASRQPSDMPKPFEVRGLMDYD